MSSYKKNIYNAVMETLLTKFINYRNLQLIETEDITNDIITEMNEWNALLDSEIGASSSKKLSNFYDMVTNNIKNVGFNKSEKLGILLQKDYKN